MVMLAFKWVAIAVVTFIVIMLVLIVPDSLQKPAFVHPLLTSEALGVHYFINDVVGISPQREQQPNAYVLSHSSRAAVLVSDFEGRNKLSPADAFGLPQDPVYPGWGAVTDYEPSDSVLHLEYLHTMIVGTVNLDADVDAPRSIDIAVPWPARGAAFGDVVLVRTQVAEDAGFTVDMKGSGSFWIETYPPPSDGFPVEFVLHGFQPGEVMVGADRVRVFTDHFKLVTRDFHSLAFTELDGDAGGDFSVVRGGIRGRMSQVSPDARDLLVDMDSNSDVARDYPGLLKHGCPGRQSGWVDIDSDNDLDLYVVCGRSQEPAKHFPNQLFINEGGRFSERAAEFGIDFANYGIFRFIDWDKDMDPDLLWASRDGDLVYFENSDGGYREQYRVSGGWKGSTRSVQLLVHDLEMDGDPDVLVVHPDGNMLLVNNDGKPVKEESRRFGLPEEALVAHWADINLDGLIDLLTATRGVYLGTTDSRFHQEPGSLSGAGFVYDARLVSFAGANGREFIFAYRPCLPGKLCGARQELLSLLRSFVHLPYDWYDTMGLFEPYDWYLNTARRKDVSETHREVSISVQGPSLNPTSIGARIDLSFNLSNESHWVGEADSSLYSRGDFSIYITVPLAITATARVSWQDGCVSSFLILPGSRSVTVPRPESCN